MAALVALGHVALRYQTPRSETVALADLSFTVARGEFLALVGPSGCGKSTVLSLLAGLITPSAGRILWPGREAAPGPDDDGRVGYMLQHDQLFPWYDVWDNVCLGLRVQRRLTAEKAERLRALLRQYGLGEFCHSDPRRLSGGMRQRAALIRTLAVEPELLLLDEPFSALDYQNRITVADDIASIIRSRRQTAILVTHDIAEAISLADRVLVLSARPGRVRADLPIRLDIDGPVIEKRRAPEFAAYFNRIWQELNGGEEEAHVR